MEVWKRHLRDNVEIVISISFETDISKRRVHFVARSLEF